MAPLAIMGAAQALMHQRQPRNPRQAAAMQRFAASLPEVARFAGTGALSSRGQVSTRFAAGLGLDALDLVLGKLAANPASASAVPELRQRLALARRTIAAAGGPRRHS